jgi:DNA-binding transcriptional LysR family regulator
LETEAPGVTLRVVPLTTRDPRQLLDEDRCDLAVGYFPSVLAEITARSESEAPLPFSHQRIYDGEYVCVMRKDHPLVRQPLTLDVFCAARHMLVSFSGRAYGFVDETLASLGRRRQVVLTVNQFFTAGRVVAHSNLLTVLPRHFISVTGIADQLALQKLPFEMSPVHVDMVWHRRTQLRGSHQWLRDAVMRAARRSLMAGAPGSHTA